MNVNTNSYTVGFACAMVLIVAALLAYMSIQLTPLQDRNIELEKKQNILATVGIEVSREDAAAAYEKNIVNSYVLNNKGEEVEGDAFSVDLGVELKKSADQQLLPVFESQKDGEKIYILPMRGKGLWGPIWGFIALKEDMSTISGAVFDHKSETPGLGAEISLGWFQEPFIGKTIFEGTELVSINVVKGGAKEDDMHAVDGISGGTITADGVTDMLAERFSQYLPFFKKKMSEMKELSNYSPLVDSTMAFNLNTIK
mgnify:CR=1 FL=1